MTDAEILERLRAYFQTKVNNLSGDEMAEGPFEDPDETPETYGDRWEAAAKVIGQRGGLRIRFEFADEPASAAVPEPAERPRWWGTEDGGIAAVMCGTCHTLGGHDDTCAAVRQREERAVAEARPHDDEPQPGDLVRVYGASGEPGVLSWVDMFGGYNGKAEVSTGDAQVVVLERAADEHADDCRGCDGPGIVPCAADRVEGDFAMRGAVAIKDLRAADRG